MPGSFCDTVFHSYFSLQKKSKDNLNDLNITSSLYLFNPIFPFRLNRYHNIHQAGHYGGPGSKKEVEGSG